MEQADVPGRADRLQETQQCTRTFREFEAIEQLIGLARAARAAADHVPYVQLRHLIAAHVGDGVAGGAQLGHHGGASAWPCARLKPTNTRACSLPW